MAQPRFAAISGEGYHNKSDAISAINLVKGASFAPIYQ